MLFINRIIVKTTFPLFFCRPLETRQGPLRVPGPHFENHSSTALYIFSLNFCNLLLLVVFVHLALLHWLHLILYGQGPLVNCADSRKAKSMKQKMVMDIYIHFILPHLLRHI